MLTCFISNRLMKICVVSCKASDECKQEPLPVRYFELLKISKRRVVEEGRAVTF